MDAVSKSHLYSGGSLVFTGDGLRPAFDEGVAPWLREAYH